MKSSVKNHHEKKKKKKITSVDFKICLLFINHYQKHSTIMRDSKTAEKKSKKTFCKKSKQAL